MLGASNPESLPSLFLVSFFLPSSGMQHAYQHLAFYVGAGDHNSGPHVCTESVFTTESSSQLWEERKDSISLSHTLLFLYTT